MAVDLITIGIYVLGVIIVALLVITIIKAKKNKSRESFIMSTDGAQMSQTGLSITGTNGTIITDGLSVTPLSQVTDDVKRYGRATDRSPSIGGAAGDQFDTLQANSSVINAIYRDARDGSVEVQTPDDMARVSRLMNSSDNQSTHSLLTRAGTRPTELEVNPSSYVGVIDKNFVPIMEQNTKLRAVGSVVPVDGYALDTSRIINGEDLARAGMSTMGAVHYTAAKRVHTAGSTTSSGGLQAMRDYVDITPDGMIRMHDELGGTVTARLRGTPVQSVPSTIIIQPEQKVL